MAEYHTVYKGREGESTQWEDIQRKLGNLPPKPPAWKPEKYAPEEEVAKNSTDHIDSAYATELEGMELDDDRFLEEYR